MGCREYAADEKKFRGEMKAAQSVPEGRIENSPGRNPR
jgi:hypothetical protein